LIVPANRVLRARLERKLWETCRLRFVPALRGTKSHPFHGWWFTKKDSIFNEFYRFEFLKFETRWDVRVHRACGVK
jgi:hypothetical protein